jgi:hypothetical protein
MDAAYEGQWNVNIVRLDALRQNIPAWIGENIVRDYNAIVHALQVASHDENMVHFRIPDSELKPRVVSVQMGSRRSPGRTNYSKDNYCDSGLFERQVQGLWSYIQRTDPQKRKEASAGLESGDSPMNLASKCNEKVTVERHDNSRYENVPALVSREMIFIPDAKIPIEPNDAILRQLPSGIVERLVVTDPGFYAPLRTVPAHYQVKYRREGQKPAGSPGYHIHLSGDNSRVNINSIDNSANTVSNQLLDFTALAAELAKLRSVLLERAQSAEHYTAIGAIASAETETKSGDASRVKKALSALGTAGRWVLDTSKEIGVPVVVELLKAQIPH